MNQNHAHYMIVFGQKQYITLLNDYKSITLLPNMWIMTTYLLKTSTALCGSFLKKFNFTNVHVHNKMQL